MGVLGVILAGGASVRMGTDKAQLAVAGTPMLERVAAAMSGAVDEAVVVGRADSDVGYRSVPDLRPAHRGPLAGLASAMPLSGGRSVLLLAVDQPLVRTETLAALVALDRPDQAVIPIDDDARQVTCAVYPAAWKDEIDAEDERSGSIQSLLDRLDYRPVLRREWESWGEDGRSWRSLDTPEDVAAAERLLGGSR